MESNSNQDIGVLEQMSVAELREEYLRVFGEATVSHNRVWLYGESPGGCRRWPKVICPNAPEGGSRS